MESQYLLNYVPIDLDKMTKPAIKTFLAEAKNVAYELRGRTNIELLLSLFLRLRTIAVEITYRPTSSTTAYVLTTHVDERMILRPSDVRLVAQFSNDELVEFEQQQITDTEKTITIDLGVWWEKAKRKQPEEPAQAFLRMLYKCAQNKQAVHLTGEVPVTLLLLAVNWFTQLATTQLFYNDNRLQ